MVLKDLCKTIQRVSNGQYQRHIQWNQESGWSEHPQDIPSEVQVWRNHNRLERCVEHYSELYSWENIVHQFTLDAIECLPVMDELDTLPTIEELSKVAFTHMR